MSILLQETLADGRALRVLRFVSPVDPVPEDIVRYVIGSLGFDSYNKYIQAQAYWRSWYRESFDGLLEGVASHLYVAEVDGEYAARLWFAYSRENGLGNFGNAFTEPRFRRQGLMGRLMTSCMADFKAAAAARLLCCASGNKFAVASYVKHGFRVIYGGETGALACTRRPGEDFFSIERDLFADAALASIRPGRPADQFITDKLIGYTRPVLDGLGVRRGPAATVPEFRVARIEAEIGNGVVNVACNAAGTVTGHAFALASGGAGILDFTVHASSLPDVPELLKATAIGFHAIHNMDLFFYAFPTDSEKTAAVRAAGGDLVAHTRTMEIYTL